MERTKNFLASDMPKRPGANSRGFTMGLDPDG